MAKEKKKEAEDAAEETKEKDPKAKDKDAKGKDAPEGEEAPAEGEGGEGAAPKKSKKKIIILGVIALVVLLGGGAGAYFVFGSKGEKKAEEGVPVDEHGNPIPQTVYYTLEQFLVNLNTGGKQSSFLKATIVLEVQKQGDVALIEANLPRLMDAFNTYLRELRSSDLAGSAGIQRLREELLLRANKALAPVKINDVLFKEIVVQ